MSDPHPRSASARRAPWPRLRVRLRQTWRGLVETVSFLAAVGRAVGRVLIGRWPEPLGTDYLAPKGAREPASSARPRDAVEAGRS